MLNVKKMREEFIEILNSISPEEFQEWLSSYRKEKALEEEKWAQMTVEERYSQIFASNCGIALDIALSNGSLNGAPKKNASKPSKTSTLAQKPTIAKPRTTKVRATNSKKAMMVH